MTKNRVLILSRTDDRIDYDTSNSMLNIMENLDTKCDYAAAELEKLVFAYDGDQLTVIDSVSGEDISSFSGIFLIGWFKSGLLEDIALSVSLYAENKGVFCNNTEALLTRSHGKLSQYVHAGLHGVSQTKFVCTIAPELFVSRAKEIGMDYPMVVKAVRGSRGRDNYLVHTEQELLDVLNNQPDVQFVAQEFVPNDGDYRLLVMGDEVGFAIHRVSQTESHLNNTSQGGKATAIDLATLDPAMLKDAIKISQLLRREVTGVDMIIHRETGKYYLLEVNNMPQLSTGSLVNEKMQALDTYIASHL